MQHLICTNWSLLEWSQFATIVGVIGGLTAAWFAYGQLISIKKATYATGFIRATELLQDEKAREERGYIYKNLKGVPFEKWTKEDKDMGEKVCQKFDTVGAMAAQNIITWDMAMHWRTTVIKTWGILKPLVYSRREKEDIDFWDDYELYASKAEATSVK